MRIKVLTAGLILSWATASFAQTAAAPPAFKFEFHGFTSGTLYVQDANLSGNGQNVLGWALPPSAAVPNPPQQDKLAFSGDVRQTRFNMSVTGPTVFGGATPKAVYELDFFGNFGSGAFGDVSLTPRMRLAYGELAWGGHKIQFGQNNDLVIGMIPVSLAHIGFPTSYGSGTVGWRRPGIWGYHTFGDLKNKDSTKVEFAWNVGRSQWNDSGATGTVCTVSATGTCTIPAASVTNGIGQGKVGAAGDPYGFSLGEASGLPALAARLTLLGGQTYSAWVTGMWEKIDRNGLGVQTATTASGISTDMDMMVGVVGAKGQFGPVSLAATGYYGKNTAPLIGSFIQFTPNTSGDIKDMGGWAQVGFYFTKELSAWYYLGAESMNHAEAQAAKLGVLGSVVNQAMLQYRDGGYAVGVEWTHWYTIVNRDAWGTTGQPAAATNNQIEANMFTLSGNYFF